MELSELSQLRRIKNNIKRSIFERAPDTFTTPVVASSTPASIMTPELACTAQLVALPLYQAIFALTYQAIFNGTIEQALVVLPRLDAMLHRHWSNTSNAKQTETLWCLIAPQDRDMAMLVEHIRDASNHQPSARYTASEHQAAVDVGTSQYAKRTPNDYQGKGVDMYWKMLQRDNLDINPKRISEQGYTHLEALKIISARHQMPLPITPNELEQDFHIVRDQTAALTHESGGSMLPLSPSYAAIQAWYLLALSNDLQEMEIGQRLIPVAPIAPDHARFWYSEGVLHNAVGMNASILCDTLFATLSDHVYAPESADMQQLIAQMPGVLTPLPSSTLDNIRSRADIVLEHPTQPRYQHRSDTAAYGDIWFMRGELENLIQKRMHHLALDQRFIIGSPFHSLATIALRLAPSHHVLFQNEKDPASLLADFDLLNAAWLNDPQSPASPWMSAGFHLALTNDIPLLNESTEQAKREDQQRDLLEKFRRLDGEEVYAQLPSKSVLGASFQQEQRQLLTTHAQEAIGNQTYYTAEYVKLHFAPYADSRVQNWLNAQGRHLWQELPDIAQLPTQNMPPMLLRIVNYYKKCAAASEKINYSSAEELSEKLNTLLSGSLGAYSALPVYNEDVEIKKILRKNLSLSDDDFSIKKTISTKIYVFPLGRTLTSSCTPMQEFKLKSNSDSSTMTRNGRSIFPAQVMQKIKPGFKAALFKNPVLRARVREMLRLQAIPYTDTDFNALLNLQVLAVIGVEPPTMLEAVRIVLEKFLLKMAALEAIVDALYSGEPRQIFGLLPFVVPAYDIEQGIQQGNFTQLKQGALNFGIDALMVWLSGIGESAMRTSLRTDIKIMQQSAMRLPTHEAANIATINSLGKRLPIFSFQTLSTTRRIVTNRDPFNVHYAPPINPEGFEALAIRARAGEKVLFTTPANDHLPLVYLADENRVTPVQAQDHYLGESNLFGALTPDAPPLFESNDFARPAQRSRGLPGGSVSITDSQLSKRTTVRMVLDYLTTIQSTPQLINKRVQRKQVLSNLFTFYNNKHALVDEFTRLMMTLYERSPTMTAIFNHANFIKQKLGSTAKRTTIFFDQIRACASNSAVCFMSDEMLHSAHYMSSTGAQAFQRERMWLHEMLHKLTHLPDVSEAGHTNRGPIVFLEDRVWDEAALSIQFRPSRNSYKKVFYSATPENRPNMVPEQIKNIGIAHDWTVAENIYLDQKFDLVTHPFDHRGSLDMMTANRVTVQQTLALDALLLHRPRPFKLQAMLDTLTSNIVGASNSTSALQQHVQRFAIQNQRFQRAYYLWQTQHINFALKIEFTHLTPLDGHLRAYEIGYDGQTIRINSDDVFYYSDHGAEPMSETRKLTAALLDLIEPDQVRETASLYPENSLRDRGVLVAMENQLMALTGDTSPRRICQGLTRRADGFLKYQTSVTRVANAEDRLLDAHLGFKLD